MMIWNAWWAARVNVTALYEIMFDLAVDGTRVQPRIGQHCPDGR
jgi:hypothetical protein